MLWHCNNIKIYVIKTLCLANEDPENVVETTTGQDQC